jgi:hypothetical protein
VIDLVGAPGLELIKRNRVSMRTDVQQQWGRFRNGLKSAISAMYLLSSVGKNMLE